MTAVLDTDFLVAVLRGDPAARAKMTTLDSQGPQATAALVCHELLTGAHRSRQPEANSRRVEHLIASLAILPFNVDAARISARIDNALSKKGVTIPLGDILIAASGLAQGLTTIVTRNAKHFGQIPGIVTEAW